MVRPGTTFNMPGYIFLNKTCYKRGDKAVKVVPRESSVKVVQANYLSLGPGQLLKKYSVLITNISSLMGSEPYFP